MKYLYAHLQNQKRFPESTASPKPNAMATVYRCTYSGTRSSLIPFAFFKIITNFFSLDQIDGGGRETFPSITQHFYAFTVKRRFRCYTHAYLIICIFFNFRKYIFDRTRRLFFSPNAIIYSSFFSVCRRRKKGTSNIRQKYFLLRFGNLCGLDVDVLTRTRRRGHLFILKVHKKKKKHHITHAQYTLC